MIFDGEMITQLIINGIITGCIYALIALGFALIYNTTRIFHFAHGAIYTLAAYLFYTFFHTFNCPLGLSVVLTLIIIALCGMSIDKFIYRPLEVIGASLLIQLLSSLGLYIIIINAIAMIYGNETKILISAIQPTLSFGFIILSQPQQYSLLLSVCIISVLFFILKKTHLGKSIRAMRDDPILISAIGINPNVVRNIVFSLGSVLAAVAAILAGLDFGIDPNMGMTAVMNSIVAVIIGGVGIFEGALMGALLLGLMHNLSILYFSNRWQDVMTFTLLIFFLLFRSQGILSSQRRSEEKSA